MANRFTILPHNWIKSVSMETRWFTVINASAETLTEERRANWENPKRVLNVELTATSQEEIHRLFMLMARNLHQDWTYVPIYQDSVRTTAASSLLTINCPTDNRRFHVGHVVVIYALDDNGRPGSMDFGVIQAVNPTNLVLSATLVGADFVGTALNTTFPVGSVVAPIFEARMSLEGGQQALTDEIGVWSATFSEKDSDKLPPFGDWSTIDGYFFVTGNAVGGAAYYLFDVPQNWEKSVDIGAQRSGNDVQLGRSSLTIPRGPQPRFTFKFSCEEPTREDAMRVLRFFDAHKGMLIPFFVANPYTFFDVQNIGVGFIEAELRGDSDDMAQFVQFVYLEMEDGTVYVRQCTSVTQPDADTLRLVLDENLPGGLLAQDVARCTLAHLCRFSNDAMREEWFSDEYSSFSIEVQEVLNEQEVTVA